MGGDWGGVCPPRLVDHLLAVERVLDHELRELEEADEVRIGVLRHVLAAGVAERHHLEALLQGVDVDLAN